jgi:hypothetical protein
MKRKRFGAYVEGSQDSEAEFLEIFRANFAGVIPKEFSSEPRTT